MIVNITPDEEKIKSMLSIIRIREDFLSTIDIQRFPTQAAENYYEIIKELIVALLNLNGLKAIGDFAHKEAIDKLHDYREFDELEIRSIDDLRARRNMSSYEGKQIDSSYTGNNKDKLDRIIFKLKNSINKRLKQKKKGEKWQSLNL